MTSFSWKRKAGDKVSYSASKAFEENADEGDDQAIVSGDVDWLSLAPQKRCLVLEDAVAKSNRLKEEGEKLAEAERYWEATRKWEAALQLTPNNYQVMDMKAQAYMMLNELYPAVQAAEQTLVMNPLWWVGHQTLGRARMGMGEVRLAIKSFSRAIHLNPDNQELWQEDLLWAVDLLNKKKSAEEELTTSIEGESASTLTITEITDDTLDTASTSQHTVHVKRHISETIPDDSEVHQRADSAVSHASTSTSKNTKKLKCLPKDYVFMRDTPS